MGSSVSNAKVMFFRGFSEELLNTVLSSVTINV